MTQCFLRLHRIVEINLMNCGVRPVRIAGARFRDNRLLPPAMISSIWLKLSDRPQSARQAYRLLRFSFRQCCQWPVQSGVHFVDRKTHRVRETPDSTVETQPPAAAVIPPYSSCSRPQTPRNFSAVPPIPDIPRFRPPDRAHDAAPAIVKYAPDHPCRPRRSLHISAQLNVLPTFAMDMVESVTPWNRCAPSLHRAKKNVGVQQPRFTRRRAVHLQIQTIELLPHFRAALLADLPQILPSRRYARNDGRRDCCDPA